MTIRRARVPQPVQIVSNPEIMGGMPCVDGTRVPADTILTYLKSGSSAEAIFHDYPSLPKGAVKAVKRWAAGSLKTLQLPVSAKDFPQKGASIDPT
jgi:uncharacterized protein (DUF433 family)